MDLPGGQNLGEFRWTVDRPDDLYFVRWVYDQLPDGFGWQDVLGLKDAWEMHCIREKMIGQGQLAMRFGA